MPKLNILITSTRPGRKGPAVAQWIYQYAKTEGSFECELIDLASFNLPVFDEPHHPATRKYQHEHTKLWSASVGAADAFVFVLPEYNHHAPSSLINAMEFLYHEWSYKPVAFVSYAGLSGGIRSVEVAKLFCTTFKMVPVLEGVIVQFFDKKMLSELRRWSDALQVLRSPGE
jgi:NAD(P)H-dependent FMN reductase